VKTSLIPVDGVLRKLMAAAPIPEGIRLYQSLSKTGSVILAAGHREREQDEDWLELHGLVHHAFVDWWYAAASPVDRANALRRQGYDIDLVVEPDPNVASGLIEAGFNTLVFVHSQYSHPSWRPDTDPGVRPWADIVRQTTEMAKMKAADTRLRDNE
jgi:hypothetical protein